MKIEDLDSEKKEELASVASSYSVQELIQSSINGVVDYLPTPEYDFDKYLKEQKIDNKLDECEVEVIAREFALKVMQALSTNPQNLFKSFAVPFKVSWDTKEEREGGYFEQIYNLMVENIEIKIIDYLLSEYNEDYSLQEHPLYDRAYEHYVNNIELKLIYIMDHFDDNDEMVIDEIRVYLGRYHCDELEKLKSKDDFSGFIDAVWTDV